MTINNYNQFAKLLANEHCSAKDLKEALELATNHIKKQKIDNHENTSLREAVLIIKLALNILKMSRKELK